MGTQYIQLLPDCVSPRPSCVNPLLDRVSPGMWMVAGRGTTSERLCELKLDTFQLVFNLLRIVPLLLIRMQHVLQYVC